MKAVILAGGRGSRLSEETELRPKPMVEIGDRPILWHILKIYAAHGVTDFVICLGYKSYFIKEYFANYFLHSSDVTFDMAENAMVVHQRRAEPWRVTLVDTGIETMTGGRLKAVEPYIRDEEAFCFTYGDGVGDVDIGRLIAFHQAEGREATVTVARPPGRFGEVRVEGHQATDFAEKQDNASAWINAGFFVLSPKVLKRISGPSTIWEQEPMNELAASAEMSAFKHQGFWHPMDTVRDRDYLNDIWAKGDAPWKIWK